MKTANPNSRVWVVPFLLSLAFLIGLSANARVFVVSDTNDTVQIDSLRGAIIAANRTWGNNTIILGPTSGFHGSQKLWTYQLTVSGAEEDPSHNLDLAVTRGNLRIVGVGSNVIIDATGGGRVFQVMKGASLALRNLTMTGGFTYAGGQEGGAIYNSGTLTIDHCSIVGNSSGPGPGVIASLANGGGIYNEGTLLLESSVVAGNSTGIDSDGGGIFNSGKAMLDHCIINSNSAGSGVNLIGSVGSGFAAGIGGGICNVGTMTLRDCIVSANQGGQGSPFYPAIDDIQAGTPSTGGPGGNGGGIWNSGHLQLLFCTVGENTGGAGCDGGDGSGGGNAGDGGNGGGIFNTGVIDVNTCTISGNLAGTGGNGGSAWFISEGGGGNGGNGGYGGGIYNEGTLNLTSCTIALNQTGAGGSGGAGNPVSSGGSGGNGGGIFNQATATNATVRNTLAALNLANVGGLGGTNQNTPPVVGNSGASGVDFDVAGDFVSQGFNFVGTADGSSGFTNGIQADQVGSNAQPIDPLLGPLQINGGFTPTQALLPGSPAIDQGDSFRIHTDQRGHKRPQDIPAIPNAPGGDGTDIGAFEVDSH